jgi:hypothetical protein
MFVPWSGMDEQSGLGEGSLIAAVRNAPETETGHAGK